MAICLQYTYELSLCLSILLFGNVWGIILKRMKRGKLFNNQDDDFGLLDTHLFHYSGLLYGTSLRKFTILLFTILIEKCL